MVKSLNEILITEIALWPEGRVAEPIPLSLSEFTMCVPLSKGVSLAHPGETGGKDTLVLQ